MASLWFCKQRSYVFYWIGHWRIAYLTSRILVCFGYITSHTWNKNPLPSDAQKAYSLLSTRCLCVSHLIREAFSDQPFLKQDYILAFLPLPLSSDFPAPIITWYILCLVFHFLLLHMYICMYNVYVLSTFYTFNSFYQWKSNIIHISKILLRVKYRLKI